MIPFSTIVFFTAPWFCFGGFCSDKIQKQYLVLCRRVCVEKYILKGEIEGTTFVYIIKLIISKIKTTQPVFEWKQIQYKSSDGERCYYQSLIINLFDQNIVKWLSHFLLWLLSQLPQLQFIICKFSSFGFQWSGGGVCETNQNFNPRISVPRFTILLIGNVAESRDHRVPIRFWINTTKLSIMKIRVFLPTKIGRKNMEKFMESSRDGERF